MKILLYPIIIVSVFLSVVTAQGAEWVLIAANVEGDTFFIDKGNIRHIQNDKVKCWMKIITKQNHPFCSNKKRRCHRIIQRILFDCKNDTVKVLHEEIYTADNDFRLSKKEEMNWYWLYPSPDSVRHTIHSVLCSPK